MLNPLAMPESMFWFESCLDDCLRSADAQALLKKNKSDHVRRVAITAIIESKDAAQRCWDHFKAAAL